MTQFYTTKEIGAMLKVTEYTVRQLIDRGELKASKVGRSWRVSETHLEEYLNQNSND